MSTENLAQEVLGTFGGELESREHKIKFWNSKTTKFPQRAMKLEISHNTTIQNSS